MENASKALIIAGAILLAIAIIGVGMYVFNNASDSVEGSDLSEEEVIAYNGDFDVYQGTIRGSRAETLVGTIKNHNLTAIDDSEKIQLLSGPGASEVNIEDIDEEATTVENMDACKDWLQSSATYTITFGYDGNSGLITTVYIEEGNGDGYYGNHDK